MATDEHTTTGRVGIGVIGLGRMGLPIARSLAAAGHDVIGWDAVAERRDAAERSGVALASGLDELAETADVVLTVLPGAAEARELLLGADSLLARLRPGSCWVDLTSGDPRLTKDASAEASAHDVDVVAAPMRGDPEAAASSRLGFYVGGAADAVERAVPLLKTVARDGGVHLVGERPEHAQVVKLLINTLWFGQAIAVAEALLLGQRAGVEMGRLATLLGESAAGSAFIDDYLPGLLDGDYRESFGLDRVVEELANVAALADELGTPFELSRLVGAIHREALDRFGPMAGELLAVKLLEERAGTRFSRR